MSSEKILYRKIYAVIMHKSLKQNRPPNNKVQFVFVTSIPNILNEIYGSKVGLYPLNLQNL